MADGEVMPDEADDIAPRREASEGKERGLGALDGESAGMRARSMMSE